MIEIFIDLHDCVKAKGLIPGQFIVLHYKGTLYTITRSGNETFSKVEDDEGVR